MYERRLNPKSFLFVLSFGITKGNLIFETTDARHETKGIRHHSV